MVVSPPTPLLRWLGYMLFTGGAQASQLCSTTGPAAGYACSPDSCVGVMASCVGAYATDCSCGDNPHEWQGERS